MFVTGSASRLRSMFSIKVSLRSISSGTVYSIHVMSWKLSVPRCRYFWVCCHAMPCSHYDDQRNNLVRQYSFRHNRNFDIRKRFRPWRCTHQPILILLGFVLRTLLKPGPLFASVCSLPSYDAMITTRYHICGIFPAGSSWRHRCERLMHEALKGMTHPTLK